MESTKVLSLDLRVKGITNVIFATQHDTGRLVKVLLSGTEGMIYKARVYCKKPSGKETYTEGTVFNDYCVLFGLTEQMLAESGTVKAQLHLMDKSRVVTSFEFHIQVSQNLVAMSNITSSDDYEALIDALGRLEHIDPVEISESEIDDLDDGETETMYSMNILKEYGSIEDMNEGFSSDGLTEGSYIRNGARGMSFWLTYQGNGERQARRVRRGNKAYKDRPVRKALRVQKGSLGRWKV